MQTAAKRTRFDVSQMNLVVESISLKDSDDGVYAPGSTIHCESVTVKNLSPHHVGDGIAVLDICGQQVRLPELSPMETRTVDLKLGLPVPRQNQPMEERTYADSMKISPKIRIGGEVVPQQRIVTSELNIQNPVEIVEMEWNATYGIEQFMTYKVSVTVENYSKKPFGQQSKYGDVRLVFDYNPKVLEICTAEEKDISSFSLADLSYGKSVLEFQIRTAEDCTNFLSQDVTLHIGVVVGDVEVQFLERTSRIVPTFKRTQTDLLLITSRWTDSDEIKRWTRLCELLDLSINFWDVEYYDGLHGVGVVDAFDKKGIYAPWISRARYVMFPHYKQCVSEREYWTFEVKDFIKFFSSEAETWKPAVCLFNSEPKDVEWFLFDYSIPKLGQSLSQKISTRSLSVRMFHEANSDKAVASKQAHKLAKQLTASDVNGHIYQPVVNLNIRKKFGATDFGTTTVYKSTIPANSNLMVCDYDLTLGTEILDEDLTSRFGRGTTKILFSLLCLMPIQERLSLLKDKEEFCFLTKCKVDSASKKFEMTITDLIFYSLVDTLSNDKNAVAEIVKVVDASYAKVETLSCVVLAALMVRASETKSSWIKRLRKGVDPTGQRASIIDAIKTITSWNQSALKDAQNYMSDKPVLGSLILINGVGSPVRVLNNYNNVKLGDAQVKANVLKHQASVSTLEGLNNAQEEKESEILQG